MAVIPGKSMAGKKVLTHLAYETGGHDLQVITDISNNKTKNAPCTQKNS
jgi:hypothetical protein